MTDTPAEPEITLDTVVSATREQVSTTLGDSMVILGLADGIYYGLDEVGQDVWALLREPVAVRDICRGIEAAYDVAPAVCEPDVLALVRQLALRRLVDVQARPGRQGGDADPA